MPARIQRSDGSAKAEQKQLKEIQPKQRRTKGKRKEDEGKTLVRQEQAQPQHKKQVRQELAQSQPKQLTR